MVSQPPDSRPTPRPPFNNGTAWLAQSGFFFVSIKTQFLLSPFLSYFELVSKNPFVSLFVCIHQTALFVCVYIKNTFPFPLLYIKKQNEVTPRPLIPLWNGGLCPACGWLRGPPRERSSCAIPSRGTSTAGSSGTNAVWASVRTRWK